MLDGFSSPAKKRSRRVLLFLTVFLRFQKISGVTVFDTSHRYRPGPHTGKAPPSPQPPRRGPPPGWENSSPPPGRPCESGSHRLCHSRPGPAVYGGPANDKGIRRRGGQGGLQGSKDLPARRGKGGVGGEDEIPPVFQGASPGKGGQGLSSQQHRMAGGQPLKPLEIGGI